MVGMSEPIEDDPEVPNADSFDRLFKSWKDIARNDGTELIRMTRRDLRILIDGMDRRMSGLGEAVYQQGHVSLDLTKNRVVRLLFSGNEGSPDLTFVEAEDESGRGIQVGEWSRQGDFQVLTLVVANEPQIEFDPLDATFGIQTHSDGRVWACINGSTFLRFKPHERRARA